MERAPAVKAGGPAARSRHIVEAPILPTLLRLSAPTMAVMILQALVSATDAYYISWLGSDALAGVTLVFPLSILMQTVSAAGIGGGVASAIARALGAGRHEDANALVVHALLIGIGAAALFTGGILWGGGALYRLLGGEGVVLDLAITYSNVLFGGAIASWMFNTLSSVLRGTGNMMLPAWLTVASATLYIVLSPALILGWGPFPEIGIAGAPAAAITAFGLGALVLLGYLLAGRGAVRPALGNRGIERRLLWEILRVGAPASFNPILANVTLVLVTGLVGQFGATALAGFGIATRLEYLQIPLIFGFGAALVTMVGINVGAGKFERAQRAAWIGAALTAAVSGAIGLFGALAPDFWIGLFTADAEVHAAGAHYLHIVGPVYAFLGFGLALYFASQGMGRVMWPLFAACVRLVIAVGGGWIAIRWFDAGLTGLFVTVSAAFVVFGGMIGVAIRRGAWRGVVPAR